MFNLEEAWQDISRGDEDAKKLLRALYYHFHAQDDLIDRDKEVSPVDMVSINLMLFTAIGDNPFYQKNKAFLLPIVVTSALAYVASEDFKKREDVIDKVASQVLKSQYVDLFFGIAFIIGSLSHALEMSRKYRDYHFDPV